MAEVINDAGVQVDYLIRQGDAWPKEPLAIVMQDPDGAPVDGAITSARLMVRASYDATAALVHLDSAEEDSPLTVSDDGSTVGLAAGAAPTDEWPTVDSALREKDWERLVWDLEVTMTATGKPETPVVGTIAVLPQVTHD